MRLTEEEAEAKRQSILQAGRTLMTNQGYSGTGVSEIAKEVGMPKGSFFNYFKNKEAFTMEMIESYCDSSLQYARQHLNNENLTPLQGLKAFYEENIYWHRDNRNYQGGCLLNALSAEVSDYSEPIANSIKESYAILLNEITKSIAAAQDTGEVSMHHDAAVLASFIDNSWRGVLITTKSTKDNKAIESFMKYTFEVLLK